jgi:hypothetical protein
MIAKTVLFFGGDLNGWQEIYYQNAASLPSSLPVADNLAQTRAQLLGTGFSVIYYRVEDDQNARVSFLTPVNYVSNIPWTTPSALPDDSGMMRLYSSAQNRTRPLYLRGVPSGAVGAPNQFPPVPDGQAWMQAYANLAALLNPATPPSVWLIKYRPRPITSGVNQNTTPIISWVTSAINSAWTVVGFSAALAGPPAPGSFIQTYKVRGLPQAPGLVEVVAWNASNNTAVVVFRTPAGYVYTSSGYGLPYTPNYDPVTISSLNPRWTRRATGRPFDVTRGRRRSVSR